MRGEAEIAHADEALKTLFSRFKEAPGSSAFEELSEALLARGHATEALQVAEHGLQLAPDNVNGRVQRAAALLALGRPRVAYVELLRALALDPVSYKGMRLLGRVYVEAGAPERAAQLLAKRLGEKSAPSDRVSAAALEGTQPGLPPRPSPARQSQKGDGGNKPWWSGPERSNAPTLNDAQAPDFSGLAAGLSLKPGSAPLAPASSDASRDDMLSPIPELFAALASDLSLGSSLPEQSLAGRVEVTQVMRLRRVARGKDKDELSSIEGPIVDTTQPGRVALEPPPLHAPSSSPPATLSDQITSPQFHILGLTLDEEPIEGLRPVQGLADGIDTIDDTDTVNDGDVESNLGGLEMAALRNALEGSPATERAKVTVSKPPPGPSEPPPLEERPPPPGEGVKSALEALAAAVSVPPAPAATPAAPGSLLPTPDLPYLRRFKRAASRTPEDEKGPKVELVAPPRKPKHVLLAVVAAVALLAYVAGLGWLSRKELRAWIAPPGSSRTVN